MTDDELRDKHADIVRVLGSIPPGPLGDSAGFHLATARRLLELLPPADDGEPVDFQWLASQAKLCEDQGYWDTPPSGDVWWEVGPISFTYKDRQSYPGEPIKAVATDWQVDGRSLPKLLVPKTRGQFRRLLELAGYKPEAK